jgi:hypothetical protein
MAIAMRQPTAENVIANPLSSSRRTGACASFAATAEAVFRHAGRPGGPDLRGAEVKWFTNEGWPGKRLDWRLDSFASV